MNPPLKRDGRKPRRRRFAWMLATAALSGCGTPAPESQSALEPDPGPIHVHGLGVNPADDALFVATHTGLFRAAAGQLRARRVAGRYQDTMGFAVLGADRFLGSGHPDLREKLPPYLGLIESRDAGRSWVPLSLQGSVDFHVLEARGRRIYGYGSDFESREPRFLTSTNGGRSWSRLEAPEPLTSLAISPTDPRTFVASGDRQVRRSRDGGRTWEPLDAPSSGYLAWNANGLFLAAGDGRVWHSSRDDAPWKLSGSIGGQPAAFDNGLANDLLVALHDGTIKHSADAGRTWDVRSQPR